MLDSVRSAALAQMIVRRNEGSNLLRDLKFNDIIQEVTELGCSFIGFARYATQASTNTKSQSYKSPLASAALSISITGNLSLALFLTKALIL